MQDEAKGQTATGCVQNTAGPIGTAKPSTKLNWFYLSWVEEPP